MENLQIKKTSDGSKTLVQSENGLSYRSLHGAKTESQEVFINPSGLHEALADFSILELGFGCGMNFLESWLVSEELGYNLDYVTIEKTPISGKLLREIYAEEPVMNRKASWLEIMLQSLKVENVDRVEFGDLPGLKQLQLIQSDVHLLDFDFEGFDAVFHDPFGPKDEPENWTQKLFEKYHKILKPGGKVCTYSSAGEVRRNLSEAGFSVEKIPGPPGKREFCLGTKI